MTKVRIYGLSGKDVVKTGWVWNSVTDETLDDIAKTWKNTYGCDRVFAMIDSKELRNTWFDFLRACGKKDGMAEFAKFEFVNYLESGDWELAKCS